MSQTVKDRWKRLAYLLAAVVAIIVVASNFNTIVVVAMLALLAWLAVNALWFVGWLVWNGVDSGRRYVGLNEWLASAAPDTFRKLMFWLETLPRKRT